MLTLGIAESARKMRRDLKKKISTQTLYRHLDESETAKETVEQTRIVRDETTGKPVEKNPARSFDTACYGRMIRASLPNRSTKERSAFATITGKVFVSEDEIAELLAEGEAETLVPGDTKIATEDEAFQFLARQKINDTIPDDSVITRNDVEFFPNS